MEKLLVTAEEAAESLGIGRSKVYELIRTGQVAWVRIGSCRRIAITELAAVIERLSSTSPTGL